VRAYERTLAQHSAGGFAQRPPYVTWVAKFRKAREEVVLLAVVMAVQRADQPVEHGLRCASNSAGPGSGERDIDDEVSAVGFNDVGVPSYVWTKRGPPVRRCVKRLR
jgi:hypothetical protein